MAVRPETLARSSWAVPVTLLAGWFAGFVAAGLLLAVLAVAGLGADLTPLSALAVSVAVAGGMVGAVLVLTPPTGRFHALGLHSPGVGAGLAWAALAALLLGAFAFLWTELFDVAGALALPEELDTTTPLEKQFGVDDDTGTVEFSTGVAVSALAHVVVPAVAAELVLRGFALPRLEERPGLWLALPVCVLLQAAPVAYAAGSGDGAIAAFAVGLGLVLCALYLATGSLYPGIGISALALGTLFGSALGWTLAGALALAAVYAAMALAVAWIAARRDRLVAEAGQVSSELLGTMLVIAVIVGVIAGSGIGAQIADGVRDQVCDVLGESCASQSKARPARAARDTDDDGLTDRRERRLGTRPARSDSDFDGVADGEEVRRGSDPLGGRRRL
jgi:membrane protease YdiL (CAAX protease family)